MEWNGMKMERNGTERNRVGRDGMERNGMERNGTEWNGMEWNGMERRRMKWAETKQFATLCSLLSVLCSLFFVFVPWSLSL